MLQLQWGEQFQSSNICWICKRLINDHDEKVRDYSHIRRTYVRRIPYFFIVIINESFAYPTNVAWLKLFFFFTHDQIFIKMFFHYFLTVFILLKNRFYKFISNIVTSKNNYWLGKFIINTNKFLRKTARNVILIFFWVKDFITFNTF